MSLEWVQLDWVLDNLSKWRRHFERLFSTNTSFRIDLQCVLLLVVDTLYVKMKYHSEFDFEHIDYLQTYLGTSLCLFLVPFVSLHKRSTGFVLVFTPPGISSQRPFLPQVGLIYCILNYVLLGLDLGRTCSGAQCTLPGAYYTQVMLSSWQPIGLHCHLSSVYFFCFSVSWWRASYMQIMWFRWMARSVRAKVVRIRFSVVIVSVL